MAEEIGIHENTIYIWAEEYGKDLENTFPGSGNLKPKEAELQRLRKEVKELREERSPTAELASMALRRALQRRKPKAGPIHHSDRGCQYTSKAYRKLLEQYKIKSSMSCKGNPYDNAPMESFFKTLKVECVYWQRYKDMDEALTSLFYYIMYIIAVNAFIQPLVQVAEKLRERTKPAI